MANISLSVIRLSSSQRNQETTQMRKALDENILMVLFVLLLKKVHFLVGET